MDNDDRQVGRILSRREVLALLGGGAAILAGGVHAAMADTTYLPIVMKDAVTPTVVPTVPTVAATATQTLQATATPTPTAALTPDPTGVCVVRPEMTVGPYFVDEQLLRSDIRTDPTTGVIKNGAELQLTLRVYAVGSSCTPLAGAYVDIWHCDAAGLYSDVAQEGTAGQKFLRGYQITDSNGVVNFTTIYPGWYSGRAVHIHFKIRDALTTNPTNYHFISQFFFNEELTTQVHAQAPYTAKGMRNTLNSTDNIYQANGGSQMLLPVAQSGNVYSATFDIGFATD
ncbi:MAG: intradiol ring-cleavage dioxygenase [Caldilineaceae bacterium]|nr:intradiol ring-cleavage dioxygenase [Caldilineaceae bacterium]